MSLHLRSLLFSNVSGTDWQLVTDFSGLLIRQVIGEKFFLDCVYFVDGTDVLPQSVGKQLLTYATQHSTRAKPRYRAAGAWYLECLYNVKYQLNRKRFSIKLYKTIVFILFSTVQLSQYSITQQPVAMCRALKYSQVSRGRKRE